MTCWINSVVLWYSSKNLTLKEDTFKTEYNLEMRGKQHFKRNIFVRVGGHTFWNVQLMHYIHEIHAVGFAAFYWKKIMVVYFDDILIYNPT